MHARLQKARLPLRRQTPSAMVVVYRIRQAWAPWGSPVASGWLRNSRPGVAGRSVGGV